MKRFLTLILGLMVGLVPLAAAQQEPLSGRVLEENGEPVAFATVVLLRGEEQVAGLATDDAGRFSLVAPAGEYTLQISYLGYETWARPVVLPTVLEEIRLQPTATRIEGVEVTAQLIRREADRFIVDVANSPVAVGKDGSELLKTAPGVWVTDEQISINGSRGARVYVNDRELKLSGEQLLHYLRSLHAEQIARIEVIPLSGADYDADSSAGIIRITLKRQREDGLMGSVGYSFTGGEHTLTHAPNLNLDYNHKRMNLYARSWFYGGDETAISREYTEYRISDLSLESNTNLNQHLVMGGATVGGVYEFNPRHSVGAEFEYWGHRVGDNTPANSVMQRGDMVIRNESHYLSDTRRDNYTLTLNYIYKIDTLGSNLKLLADYSHRGLGTDNDNVSQQWVGDLRSDSLYYDRTTSRYDVLTATLAWEQVLTPKWRLKAGAKYTRNDTHNSALYRYWDQSAWVPSVVEDYRIDYTENIGALYAIVSGRFGRFSLTAGLRGEYTYTDSEAGAFSQRYFSLFPNANIAWQMDKEAKHTLVASYARSIVRPNFWDLTPSRTKISDYSYQTGNPELRPCFKDDYSLTLVMWYKYSLTLGMGRSKDNIQQVMIPDPIDEDMLMMTRQNVPDLDQYYATLSAPVQLAKWWGWNTNLTFVRMGQRLTPESPLAFYNIFQAYTAMTFELSAKFTLEASYFYQSRATAGNIQLDPRHDLGASIKKRLLKDQLILSLQANYLLDQPTVITAEQPEFRREYRIRQSWGSPQLSLRISYNFQAGKAFRSRSVESGSAEEKARM